MSFSSDINKFTIKAKGNSEKVIRGTFFALSSRITLRSPVLSGRLRGDWQATIGRPTNSNSGLVDKSGSATIKAIAGQVAGFKLGGKLYYINTMSYAKRIEDGYSRVKAPAGMVKVTIAEFQSEISKQARKVR